MARCTVLHLGGQTAERLDEAGLVGRATFNGEAGRVPSAPRSALERGDAAFLGGSDLVAVILLAPRLDWIKRLLGVRL